MEENVYVWDNIAKIIWPIGSVYCRKRDSLDADPNTSFNPSEFTDASWIYIKEEDVELANGDPIKLDYYLRTG